MTYLCVTQTIFPKTDNCMTINSVLSFQSRRKKAYKQEGLGIRYEPLEVYKLLLTFVQIVPLRNHIKLNVTAAKS